jgi:signal transduction histidine kinase
MAVIDDQITQLLPSAQVARVYHSGQGLMGAVWKQREFIILRPETANRDVRVAQLLEPDAPHHLAVPVFLPERLDRVSRRVPVIGALRVFNRDEMWSYSTNDARLLELHADRLARALALLEAPSSTISQDDLVATLRELGGAAPTQDGICRRVVDIIVRQNPALGVCIILRGADSDELIVALSSRRGVTRQSARLASQDVPQVVRRALQGELVDESMPPSGANTALYTLLGWESNAPALPLVVAPIGANPRTAGALLVTAAQGERFAPEQTARLEALALAASVFLENARLVQDARHSVLQFEARSKQLAELNNAVLTLNSSLDEAISLQQLADQAQGVTTAEVSAVFVRDEENKLWVCRAVSPTNNRFHDLMLGVAAPLDWRNMSKRFEHESYITDTAGDDDEGVLRNERASLLPGEVIEFLAAPIIRQETQLGALAVFTPGQPAHFLPRETQLLVSLASQAAVAIHNARLYKQLEEAYERQKELDRLKNDFILTVSHEFRTPLTAIEGYVTLISRHGQKLEAEKLETFASEIHQATAQLAGMISMLADASRMSDQELRVTSRPISLASAATEAINHQPPEEKKRIQTRIEDGLIVMGDDERLPLVFSNLISNALKYSSADKPCRVIARRTTRAALGAERRRRALEDGAPEEWALVTVEDEGPGIAPEDQARLFQKFMRLQQSLTTSVRGTGLGLWICRQYVEAMGGEIWVESRMGHGARFNFILPRAEAPANKA